MATHPPFPPPPRPDPLACPRCGAYATPGAGHPAAQTCTGCKRRFTLTAGPLLDARVVPPPPHPAATNITTRWSIVLTYRFAALEHASVSSGTLDPVIAIHSVDKVSIPFSDVASIAVWRSIGWSETIAGILLPLPVALFCAYVGILAHKAPAVAAVFGIIALSFGALTAWMLHRGIAIGRRYARVVGRWQSLTLRFDKSRAFYGELFRRCGLIPPPVP